MKHHGITAHDVLGAYVHDWWIVPIALGILLATFGACALTVWAFHALQLRYARSHSH